MFVLVLLFILISCVYLILLNIRKQRYTPRFFIFSCFIFTTIIWISGTYLALVLPNIYLADLVTKTVMIIGVILIVIVYTFIKNIDQDSKFLFPNYLILTITGICELTFMSPFLIKGVSVKPFDIIFGPLIFIYILLLIIWFIMIIWNSIHMYKETFGYSRIVMEYFNTGWVLTIFFVLITNLFLPLLHIYSLTLVGAFSVMFIISLTYYVITRTHISDLRKIWSVIISTIIFMIFSLCIVLVFNFFIHYIVNVIQINTLLFIDVLLTGFIYIFFYNLSLYWMSGIKIFKHYDSLDLRDNLNSILNSNINVKDGLKNFISYIISNTDISNIIIYIDNVTELQYKYKELFEISKKFSVNGDNIIFIYDITDLSIQDKFKNELIEVVSILKNDINNIIIGAIFWKNKKNYNYYLNNDLNFINHETRQVSAFLTKALLFEENKSLINNLQGRIEQATSELEGKNEALEKANDELKGLDKAKDDLLSIASHELRTPASIVKGNVYMAQASLERLRKIDKTDKVEIEKLTRYIERSVESIENEIRIVNTLLEASRLGKEDMSIFPEYIDIDDMVASQIDAFKKNAREKGLKLEQKSGHIGMIVADRAKIEEVIGNLITNAIKYSEHGTIEISTEKTDKEIIVHVKDEGIGIKQEDIPGLFQKFHRLHNYTGNPSDPQHLLVRPGGTGLGLYVVKGIIEKHEGKVWVESEVGKGSTFSFSLPIKELNNKESDNKSKEMFKRLGLK